MEMVGLYKPPDLSPPGISFVWFGMAEVAILHSASLCKINVLLIELKKLLSRWDT